MKESNKWYDQATDPLKAEEIEGRIVLEKTSEYGVGLVAWSEIEKPTSSWTACKYYILIPLPEEQPLEFCGINVHVVQNTPNSFQWAFATKEDCERVWNEFIRRVKDE